MGNPWELDSEIVVVRWHQDLLMHNDPSLVYGRRLLGTRAGQCVNRHATIALTKKITKGWLVSLSCKTQSFCKIVHGISWNYFATASFVVFTCLSLFPPSFSQTHTFSLALIPVDVPHKWLHWGRGDWPHTHQSQSHTQNQCTQPRSRTNNYHRPR